MAAETMLAEQICKGDSPTVSVQRVFSKTKKMFARFNKTLFGFPAGPGEGTK